MTTLYRPVLIETAEQAEALPRGTVAMYGGGNMTLTAHRVTSIAAKPDAWNSMDDLLSSSDMVGWAALVPIEAEEEYGAEMKWDARTPRDTHVSLGLNLDNARWQAENNPDYATGRIMRQYRTPWEEA